MLPIFQMKSRLRESKWLRPDSKLHAFIHHIQQFMSYNKCPISICWKAWAKRMRTGWAHRLPIPPHTPARGCEATVYLSLVSGACRQDGVQLLWLEAKDLNFWSWLSLHLTGWPRAVLSPPLRASLSNVGWKGTGAKISSSNALWDLMWLWTERGSPDPCGSSSCSVDQSPRPLYNWHTACSSD